MLDTETPDCIKGVMENDLDFLANFRLINDVSRLKEFMVKVNEKLKWGGYFVGVVEHLDQRIKRKFVKSPKFLQGFLHFVDFMWSRVFSKLPVLHNIYFFIHKNRIRAMSWTEMLGRLHFYGFKIVQSQEIAKLQYFVAKKIRTSLKRKQNSWGLLFKQKRIGKNGDWIYVYKFRTMHPYAEYLHKYMHKRNDLNDIGKIRDDERITKWGHILRKYWIDELPMLINFLQGDLKLIGLRPISASFFDLYPEDLKQDRIKLKPGLFPSFYREAPKTIDEIWEAERKYIKRYLKHPFRTDFVYFFSVLYNIAFKGVRSG
jgi:lipopolysaccharide/colanic/teichoic acid biosynthesis glycosyltransferase